MKPNTLGWEIAATRTLVLVVGFLFGLAVALAIERIDFDFSSEMVRAREIGIVSVTILEGSSRQRDLLTYVTLLALPPLGALLACGVWSWRRREVLGAASPTQEPTKPSDASWRWTLLIVTLLLVLASFNISSLMAPAWNQGVGAWFFHGEEGENLAWAQSILQGGVYGKDFFCLYGPLLVYPLAWLMQLFEPTVVTERVLKYGFDLCSYAIVLAFLYHVCRSRVAFVLFAGVWFLLFPTFTVPSVNFTYLRFALPLLAILLVLRHADAPGRKELALTGVVLGVSLLFSQDAGVGGLGAVIAVLFLRGHAEGAWKRVGVELGIVVIGMSIAVAPMLVYLATEGALNAFVDNLVGYSRLSMLGSGGKRIPPLHWVWEAPSWGAVRFYAVVLFYAAAAASLAPAVWRRVWSRDDRIVAALVVYGAIVYVIVARRYAPENIDKVWAPAVLIFLLMLDRSAVATFSARGLRRVAAASAAVGLLAFAGTVYSTSLAMRRNVPAALRVAFDDKWVPVSAGVSVPELPRTGGILFHPSTATTLRNIGKFLAESTTPDEMVYFFPNEAAYYFLFDRKNPTRYPMAYFAVTSEQRRELVADLERHRPRFVIYSFETWRIDGINERVQAPEVVDYLTENYRLHTDLGGPAAFIRKSEAESR